MKALGKQTACLLLFWITTTVPVFGQTPVKRAIEDARRKVVKIYGAGGLSGLEAYQSGFLISPEGHVATAWSYVLDVEPVVILGDGRRFQAEVVGFEPRLELAVLKIEASDLPYFSVKGATEPQIGLPVLAVSNLFNIAAGSEAASAMQGYVAGVTDLNARRGVFEAAYQGQVLVLDLVANNPGAAGGALVTRSGQLLGMLGKELRDQGSGAWLNYALPVSVLRPKLISVISGEAIQPEAPETVLDEDKAHNVRTLGLVMIPNVLDQTPAYIDTIVPESAAAQADLKPDDLILMIGNSRVENQVLLGEQLRRIDRRDSVSLLIQRGKQILPVTLDP